MATSNISKETPSCNSPLQLVGEREAAAILCRSVSYMQISRWRGDAPLLPDRPRR